MGVSWQAKASACSTLAPPAGLVGYPSDSQTGVPTDAVPFYDVITARLEDPAFSGAQFTLTSASGESIPLSVERSHPWTVSLTPARRLSPDTSYVLRYSTTEEVDQVTFTTGSGPVAVAPSPPAAFLEHYQTDEPTNSCAPAANGTCIAFPAGAFVEEASIDAFGQVHQPYLHTTPYITNLSGIGQGTNFECVKLRTRAANGTYSEPVVLCGDEASTVTVEGGRNILCGPQGIALALVPGADPAPKPDPGDGKGDAPRVFDSGCSFAPPATGAGAIRAAALLALAGLFTRRRRAE